VKPGTVENGIFSELDCLPTLADAAGNPNITDQLLKGVTLEGRMYKNHLDGYDQIDLLTGKGPSKRHELFYFSGPQLGALRVDDFKFQFLQQPYGWPGEKVTTDMPTIVNSAPGSVRADAVDPGREVERLRRRVHKRLLRLRVLAFRGRTARSGEARGDCDRISPDAGAGVVQPRRDQAGDRGEDQGTRRRVAEARLPRQSSSRARGKREALPPTRNV